MRVQFSPYGNMLLWTTLKLEHFAVSYKYLGQIFMTQQLHVIDSFILYVFMSTPSLCMSSQCPRKLLGKVLVYVCLKGLYAGYPNFVGSTQVKAVHEGTIQCSRCTLTFQGSP